LALALDRLSNLAQEWSVGVTAVLPGTLSGISPTMVL